MAKADGVKSTSSVEAKREFKTFVGIFRQFLENCEKKDKCEVSHDDRQMFCANPFEKK